jgi:hypothetical protein
MMPTTAQFFFLLLDFRFKVRAPDDDDGSFGFEWLEDSLTCGMIPSSRGGRDLCQPSSEKSENSYPVAQPSIE